MLFLYLLTSAMKPTRGGRRSSGRSSSRSRSVKAFKPKGRGYTVYYR